MLAAARRTLLRNGCRGATLERVTEEAGVSKQTLYTCFADKKHSFGALVEAYRRTEEIEALELALSQVAAGEPEAAPREASRALFRNASRPDCIALHRIMVEIAAELPEVMSRLRQRVPLQNVAAARAALEAGMVAGAVRSVDAEAIAYRLCGIGASCGLFRPPLPDQVAEQLSPDRLAAALADLVAHGLLSGRAQETKSRPHRS